jgi:hypothetical protein
MRVVADVLKVANAFAFVRRTFFWQTVTPIRPCFDFDHRGPYSAINLETPVGSREPKNRLSGQKIRINLQTQLDSCQTQISPRWLHTPG